MMASTACPSLFHLKASPCLLNTNIEVTATSSTKLKPTKPTTRRRTSVCFGSSSSTNTHLDISSKDAIFKPKPGSFRSVLGRACSDDGRGGIPGSDSGGGGATSQQESSAISEMNLEETDNQPSSLGDSYVALFVRMLGLDNDPLDREQAIEALWKYSLGGKKCIDNVMQFQGCINLTINLLQSESSSTCEAAAGLLRSISSINQYRDVVAESGAIEEIAGLLSQPTLTSEVKEQSICTLWNLSVDEKFRIKITNSDILPVLIKSLDDEDMRVKEATGGVLANLALTHTNHSILVEAGVIPKLAKFLQSEIEDEDKVIRKEARNALVELVKNEYYRILIIEEGLVPVPLIGAAAYRSFTPALQTWPSLPDGTKIEHAPKSPSRFGASELLLGLNMDDNKTQIEEAKMKAMIGRSKQQFLARSGAIEVEDAKLSQTEPSTKRQFTVLPWIDGVARLVLILELEDKSAICRAAESIADASINEHMRNSFKEAGAIKRLVQLLDHNSDNIRFSVLGALERLSLSNGVCQTIEDDGVISPLIGILKNTESSESMMEKALDLLARIFDPTKELKSKFYDGTVNGPKKGVHPARGHDSSTGLSTRASEILNSNINTRQDLLEPLFIARLVGMLKHSSTVLQIKAACVLEFVAIIDATMDTIIAADVQSGLDAAFRQNILNELESDIESQQPEQYFLQIEEAGLAISAASRLLTRLLDSQQFCSAINSTHFTKLLREILKSNIPLHYKDWVAACLVKLSSLSGPTVGFENPIDVEVTLYEAIPRLLEQIRTSFSPDAQEAAVVELNRIVSEGVIDATRALAAEGGIFPLVRLIEGGNERAVEAALSILYNLSMDNENHSAIVAAGAVPALRRIILSQRPQWKQALHLLRTLPT